MKSEVVIMKTALPTAYLLSRLQKEQLPVLHTGGVRFPHKIVSLDSCHFPYRYDVISPTQLQEVFYSPTPIMAVPLNIRWQFPQTFCWYPSPLIQTSGHTNLINHIQYCTSYIKILSSNSFIGHVSGNKGKSSQKVRYQSSVQRRGRH